ncbi:TIGR03668 family PPOX class F420-dependent oxidoreductase [Georgenia sp. EYE_87]|uniref:TIGR03668 family PPOX class F420-dependent oxidoreductase n=1 Tax=Georgenia sp. EYE_87 TaxID=2853448 RepID=UPI00200637FD|nr:TIGR03668 family PPOX class F420-dependent oxidoreductase [Georgenia sp. EYE_87]MCK6211604.1 TIGR03668 family PPOX class F420-dependent oxidoreductase [Georgenia sp. EYE_87]
MDDAARARFAAARVGRLATVTPAGDPRVVPVAFALVGDVVWTAVDAKPKSTRRLQRLANVAAHPSVSLLVDHYEEDWSALWWVRADGTASVVPVDGSREVRADGTASVVPADATSEVHAALAALAAKYPQYADPPAGPLIRVAVTTWRAWSAVPGRPGPPA